MKKRIEVLHLAKLIDEDIKKSLISIVELLDKKWKIKLTEENGGMMITHLGRACMRVKNGEEVNGLNLDTYNEIKESPLFDRVKKLYADIALELSVQLPKEEKRYMYANLLFLLEE